MASWKSTVSGNWSTNSNWFEGAPPPVGSTATFVAGTTLPAHTVTLDTPATLSEIELADDSAGTSAWSLVGTQTLTLVQRPATGGGDPTPPLFKFSEMGTGVTTVSVPLQADFGVSFYGGTSSPLLLSGNSTVNGPVSILGTVRVTGNVIGVSSYLLETSTSSLILAKNASESLSAPVRSDSQTGRIRKEGVGDLTITVAQPQFNGYYEFGTTGALILNTGVDATITGTLTTPNMVRKLGATTVTFDTNLPAKVPSSSLWRVEQGKLILKGLAAKNGSVQVQLGASLELQSSTKTVYIESGAGEVYLAGGETNSLSALSNFDIGGCVVQAPVVPSANSQFVHVSVGPSGSLGSSRKLGTLLANTEAVRLADNLGSSISIRLDGGSVTGGSAGLWLARGDSSSAYVYGSSGVLGTYLSTIAAIPLYVGCRDINASGGVGIVDLAGTARLYGIGLYIGESALGSSVTLRASGTTSRIAGSTATLALGGINAHAGAHQVLTVDGSTLNLNGTTSSILRMKSNTAEGRSIINIINGGALWSQPTSIDITGISPKIINVDNGTYHGKYLAGVTVVAHDGGITLPYGDTWQVAPVVASGHGLGSVTITNPGAGYKYPPLVRIIGGTGVGASARAEINSAGEVSAIVVTGRGTGYLESDILEVSLVLGGRTVNAAATANLTPHLGTATVRANPGAGYSLFMRTDFPFKGALIVENGTYVVGGGDLNAGTVGFNNASPVELPASTSKLDIARKGEITLSGTISGAGTISNQTSYLTTLVGDNSGFTGTVSGSIRVSSPTALGSGTGTIVATSGSLNLAATLITGTNRLLQLKGPGLASPSGGGLGTLATLPGDPIKSFSPGALRVEADNTWAGPIQLTGLAYVSVAAGKTFTLTSPVGITGRQFLYGHGGGTINIECPVDSHIEAINNTTIVMSSAPVPQILLVRAISGRVVFNSPTGSSRMGTGSNSRATVAGTGSIQIPTGTTQLGRHTYANLTLSGGRIIIGD